MSGVIPYLIRAYCDWIEDNKLTPYLLVNTNSEGIIVPCSAALSIYAQENGEGMMFDTTKPAQEKEDKKPSLKILD